MKLTDKITEIIPTDKLLHLTIGYGVVSLTYACDYMITAVVALAMLILSLLKELLWDSTPDPIDFLFGAGGIMIALAYKLLLL